MANFKRLSRYTGGLATKNRSGKDFLILRNQLDLLPDEGDSFITVTQTILDRPDLLSNEMYNTPDLWWVIFEFNGISDPLFGLKLGDTLRIPELDRVLAAINKLVTI
jgi:hypothetical protein